MLSVIGLAVLLSKQAKEKILDLREKKKKECEK